MGFHWPDLALVAAVAFLIFGPRRLPEMGSAVGKTLREFKKSMNEFTEAATTEASQSHRDATDSRARDGITPAHDER